LSRWLRVAIAAAGVATIAASACRERHPASDSASHPALGSISLDSCERLDAQSHPQSRVFAPGESLPAPHAGSWSTTRPIELGGLHLDVPVTVEVNPPNREGVHALWDFPGCRFACGLSVLVTQDSTHAGLDGYLATLHAVSPPEPGDEPAEMPGPARFVSIDGERAAYMDTPCGDCTSALIVAVHGGRVVQFNVSLDDQEGYQPGLMCRLARVATSARWSGARRR
jgi:hypothetical protein